MSKSGSAKLKGNVTLSGGSNVTLTQSGQDISIASSGGGGLGDGDYGDITVSGGGTIMTIDNDVVTYAKMQNVSATDKILGRATAGAGDTEEIDCTAAGRALIDDATAADQRTTLGFGAMGVKVDIFTSNDTWTKPTGALFVIVMVFGGGGGGGGGASYSAGNDVNGGGGGGSGAFSKGSFLAFSLGATESVTVGASGSGGAGGSGSGDNNGLIGSDGGDSSFGNWIKATGGKGGAAGIGGLGPVGSSAGGVGGNTFVIERIIPLNMLDATYNPRYHIVTSFSGGDSDGAAGSPNKNGHGSATDEWIDITPFACGGGAGGGVDSLTQTPQDGGNGGYYAYVGGGVTAGTGGTGGGNGGNGNYLDTSRQFGGSGAGGGAGTITMFQNAGNGGNGAMSSGGGGGGGSLRVSGSLDGGSGGNGGDGAVVVISFMTV